MKKILIQSITSDIGFNLANYWLDKGMEVYGTFRNKSEKLEKLIARGVKVCKCDLTDKKSIKLCIIWLTENGVWDAMVVCAGLQQPIGSFLDIEFDDWETSLHANFIGQFRFVQKALKFRNLEDNNIPVVLFFAGGGTNNATLNYSAYTISKIATIKMCELLDAEILDTSFTVLGPGWVNTKIHQATLTAGEQNAGENYQKTKFMLENDQCFLMEKVVECCDWLVNSKRGLISGRNFSAVNDPWQDQKINTIMNDSNNFKLRRYGNKIFE